MSASSRPTTLVVDQGFHANAKQLDATGRKRQIDQVAQPRVIRRVGVQ
jgi:hypothetical protein